MTPTPNILAIPLDSNASGYHRIIQPLFELTRCDPTLLGNVQYLGRREDQLSQYEWADVLFIQNLYSPDAYDFYENQKRKGKTIVLDFDDDYLNIPEDSPEKSVVIEQSTGMVRQLPADLRRAFVQKFLKLADRVVVTNAHLKQLYSPWQSNITVIPNYVSAQMRRTVPRVAHKKIRILWSGSASHLPDLRIILDALKAITASYGAEIEWHFQGPTNFQSAFPGIPFVIHPTVPFGDYFGVLQAIDADIALAPLRHHIFNRSKSNLKYLQMTLMESAFVASDYGPYTTIQHGVNGMLADGDAAWVEALTELVDNKSLRHTLVVNAARDVEENYMIEDNLYLWKSILVGPYAKNNR